MNHSVGQPVKVASRNRSGYQDGEITKIGRKYLHITFGGRTETFDPVRQRSTDNYTSFTFRTLDQYDNLERVRAAHKVIKAHGLQVIPGTDHTVGDLEEIASALESR